MICISVTPESRRLAKVDLLNAARQGDLVELCLDRLIKPPDVAELLEGLETPVLISCRSEEQGGRWAGGEGERLALLREAALAGPDYLEVEIDRAGSISLVEGTKLVVAFTSLSEPLFDVEECFARAAEVHADVIKFTWPTPTLDEAWPLISAVAKERDIPVVGMGLGHAALTFSLLVRKYGSPWIYAALEKGMEVHDGQASLRELDEVYGWRQIDRKTRFIGAIGFGASKLKAIKAFNRGFTARGVNARCLPLEVGRFEGLTDMLDKLKIEAVFTTQHLGEHLLPLADIDDEAAHSGKNADLLYRQPEGWAVRNTLWKSGVRCLERLLPRRSSGRRLEGKDVIVFGSGRLAQTLVYGIQHRKGRPLVTAVNEGKADDVISCESCGASLVSETFGSLQLAQLYNVQFLPFDAIYEADADVAVFADSSIELGYGPQRVNPAFLRPSMIVMDVTRAGEDSDLLIEARQHGCRVVEPYDVLCEQLKAQFKTITGEDLPSEALRDL